MKYTPANSATNRDRPIPTGAKKVPLCFSAASMRMVKTRRAVRNISMNSPRAMDVSPPRVVETLRGPGKSADTTPEAAIEPRSWARKIRPARNQGTAPMRAMARVTAGLKRPVTDQRARLRSGDGEGLTHHR